MKLFRHVSGASFSTTNLFRLYNKWKFRFYHRVKRKWIVSILALTLLCSASADYMFLCFVCLLSISVKPWPARRNIFRLLHKKKKKTSPAWNSFVTYYLFLAYKFSSLPKTEEENSSEWMWLSSASSLLKVHFLVQGKNFKCFLHPLSYSFVGSDLFRALQVMDVLVRTPSLFLALNMPHIFFNEFNLLA